MLPSFIIYFATALLVVLCVYVRSMYRALYWAISMTDFDFLETYVAWAGVAFETCNISWLAVIVISETGHL